MYYTEKKEIKQEGNSLFIGRTHGLCKPHARCKQIHKCKTCHEINAKKQLNKYLGHITDKQLRKFKRALYVTVTPNMLGYDFNEINANLDYYISELTSTAKQRYKKHPLFMSEYIIFKEITKSSHDLNLLPHLHIILLTNNENLLLDNPLFDYDVRDIEINLDEKYKNDKKNPLTQTLKKIFAYSTKADKNRMSFERTFDTSKGKSDVKISSLFKPKVKKSHNLIPIHIEIETSIKQHARNARKEALKKHEAFKAKHKRAKHITIHRHALKIKKELQKIEQTKKELLSRARAKLKHAERRARRRGSRTQ